MMETLAASVGESVRAELLADRLMQDKKLDQINADMRQVLGKAQEAESKADAAEVSCFGYEAALVAYTDGECESWRQRLGSGRGLRTPQGALGLHG